MDGVSVKLDVELLHLLHLLRELRVILRELPE